MSLNKSTQMLLLPMVQDNLDHNILLHYEEWLWILLDNRSLIQNGPLLGFLNCVCSIWVIKPMVPKISFLHVKYIGELANTSTTKNQPEDSDTRMQYFFFGNLHLRNEGRVLRQHIGGPKNLQCMRGTVAGDTCIPVSLLLQYFVSRRLLLPKRLHLRKIDPWYRARAMPELWIEMEGKNFMTRLWDWWVSQGEVDNLRGHFCVSNVARVSQKVRRGELDEYMHMGTTTLCVQGSGRKHPSTVGCYMSNAKSATSTIRASQRPVIRATGGQRGALCSGVTWIRGARPEIYNNGHFKNVGRFQQRWWEHSSCRSGKCNHAAAKVKFPKVPRGNPVL